MVNSIPTVFRAEPFGGANRPSGLGRELWLPVQFGFFPLKGREAGATTERFFEENRELMEKHNIRTSYLTCFSGAEFITSPASTGTMNWVSSD